MHSQSLIPPVVVVHQDCAARVNRFLELENVAQALIAIELLISDGKWSGKWFSILMGFVHSLATIYLAYLYFSQKLRLKANHEAFDQISALRKTRRELLIFHFCGLLFIFFRFIGEPNSYPLSLCT